MHSVIILYFSQSTFQNVNSAPVALSAFWTLFQIYIGISAKQFLEVKKLFQGVNSRIISDKHNTQYVYTEGYM